MTNDAKFKTQFASTLCVTKSESEFSVKGSGATPLVSLNKSWGAIRSSLGSTRVWAHTNYV